MIGHRTIWNRSIPVLALLASSLAGGSAHGQFGTVISGAGPVNRSMAGASVAAPLSPAGAIYWNPATLSGLERSELEAGAELLYVRTRLESSVAGGAFGPGIPATAMSASTSSDGGPYALPTMALAYLPDGSPLAFGLGVFSMAGYGVNYPGSFVNPVLTAPPPAGIGFGPIYSEYQFLQITPAVSCQLSEQWSVGFGLNVDMVNLRLDPGVIGAPDNANGDAFATYPSATHGRTAWGGGFALGVYYRERDWGAGASLRSPQWVDTIRINSADEIGMPRNLQVTLNEPMILSVGAAYTGIERCVFAVDVRYLDFANSKGFGDEGFRGDGSLRGLGWNSIFAVAVGGQYRPTDCTSVRAGLSWNENPIPDSQTFVNVASPTITQYMGFFGASWDVTCDLTFSVAYMHAFENSISGTMVTPAGPLPGTQARSSLSGDALLFGMSVKFGGVRCDESIQQ